MRDISENSLTVKCCFKCSQSLLDNLNISCNYDNSMTILWNKYQIFVYDKLNFNEAIKTIVPDFQIVSLIVSKNYLACLDTNGRIHIEALKFKNAAPKQLKTESKLKNDDNLVFTHYDTDLILCLKYELGKLRVCVHGFDTEFKILHHIRIMYDANLSLLQIKRQDIILKSFIVHGNKQYTISNIKNCLNITEDIQGAFSLLVTSFDRKTIHISIFSFNTKHNETQMKMLYSCPSEVANIEIIDVEDLYVLIGLKSGTIIKLSLTDDVSKTNIVHLNTAINNLLICNDALLYTDGLTMWKSENTYNDNIKLTKSIITQVKDLIQANDTIICTTFTKLIYTFQINDQDIFIDSNIEEYVSANVVLNNSHYLQRIIDEIAKNDVLVKKINEEENFILTLSLSNRQDIMDKILHTNIMVYKNYEDVIKENPSIILIERINAYFERNTLCMLLNICVQSMHHIFEQILFGDIRIHITFISDNKIIKTCSIKLLEKVKNVKYLIPLKTKSYRIKAFVILATRIPGAYDENQTVWNVLYKKEISLNSEHFIKTEEINKNIILMRSEESLPDLIICTVINQYGNIFKFTETNRNVFINNDMAFYVKLPNNYKEILHTDDYCKSNLSIKKSEFLLQQYCSEEFLNSKNNLLLLVADNKVTVEIIADSFANPVLKVFSQNMMVAYDIRNFFAHILYDKYQSNKVGEEYINHTFYTVVENNRKSLKDCIRTSNIEEMKQQIAHFERNIIGNLPI